MSRPTVFISSTNEDLRIYRQAARDAALRAGFFPIMQEYWSAEANEQPKCPRLARADRYVPRYTRGPLPRRTKCPRLARADRYVPRYIRGPLMPSVAWNVNLTPGKPGASRNLAWEEAGVAMNVNLTPDKPGASREREPHTGQAASIQESGLGGNR